MEAAEENLRGTERNQMENNDETVAACSTEAGTAANVNTTVDTKTRNNQDDTGTPLDFDIPSTSILCTLRQGNAALGHKPSTMANEATSDSTSAERLAVRNSITSMSSIRSTSTIVCRICHNAENPEKLVSPCNCRGTLSHVHIYCLERWISTSRCTTCELCHFQYNTEQTLRYTCFQSLRIFYSRNLSRRALQEDCQMFSMLTLVAFGIIGTLLVGLQYYILQGTWGLARIWTRGWLLFFLFTTLVVYMINVYMIMKAQLTPWYRWWQSARDIKLIIENRQQLDTRPTAPNNVAQTQSMQSMHSAPRNPAENLAIGHTDVNGARAPATTTASHFSTIQTASRAIPKQKNTRCAFNFFHKKLGSGESCKEKSPKTTCEEVVQPFESYTMIV